MSKNTNLVEYYFGDIQERINDLFHEGMNKKAIKDSLDKIINDVDNDLQEREFDRCCESKIADGKLV